MPDKTTNDNIPPGFTLRNTLRGHRDAIFRVAWSPDGKTPASVPTMRRSASGTHKRDELCEPWRVTLIVFSASPGRQMEKPLYPYPVPTIGQSTFGILKQAYRQASLRVIPRVCIASPFPTIDLSWLQNPKKERSVSGAPTAGRL
jgi:hypothetical protein